MRTRRGEEVGPRTNNNACIFLAQIRRCRWPAAMRLSRKRSCGCIHNICSCGRMPTMQQATTSADSLGKAASAALHKAETLAQAAHEAAVREAEEAEKTIALARQRVEQHKAALDAILRLKSGLAEKSAVAEGRRDANFDRRPTCQRPPANRTSVLISAVAESQRRG